MCAGGHAYILQYNQKPPIKFGSNQSPMTTIVKSVLLASFAAIFAEAAPPSFQHVIVIVQENRTPDNLFQGLCAPPYGTQAGCNTTPNASQYNIQMSSWLNKAATTGTTKPTGLALDSKYDMSHTHPSFVAMCDVNPKTGTCKMDGAASVTCTPTCPTDTAFSFVSNTSGLLNPYLDLATRFGWANYMFQTNQGPSFPAHQFLFGGTSAPSAADDAAGIFVAENASKTPSAVGCTAPKGTTVLLIDPNGSETEAVYPCFEHMTMVDLLPSTFTWRYYAPSVGSLWTAPNAIQHICESTGPGGKCTGKSWAENVDLVPADVLKDIQDCTLRSMSWVVPTGANSDHGGINDGGGPSWVASIVNAIGNSTSCDANTGYWKDTAILIVWDDWGGWYDHEPPTFLPKPQGDYQYGFRVPFIVVSAYTPEGYINNDRHDFGSILRFIEFNFGIAQGALNFADARGKDDLTDFFPLSHAQKFVSIQAPKDASFFLNDTRPATDPDDDQ
jgi:phospholipase C